MGILNVRWVSRAYAGRRGRFQGGERRAVSGARVVMLNGAKDLLVALHTRRSIVGTVPALQDRKHMKHSVLRTLTRSRLVERCPELGRAVRICYTPNRPFARSLDRPPFTAHSRAVCPHSCTVSCSIGGGICVSPCTREPSRFASAWERTLPGLMQ